MLQSNPLAHKQSEAITICGESNRNTAFNLRAGRFAVRRDGHSVPTRFWISDW